MGRIFGFAIGIIWLGLAFGAFRSASNGWAMGQPDWGFWWTVVAGLLTIAGTASDLYLAMWNRGDDSQLTLDGDGTLMEYWREASRVRWSGGE